MLSNHIDQVPSKTGGPPEKKEVLLEDHDPIWLELRHAHIADVCMENPPSRFICFVLKIFDCQFIYINQLYTLSG